MKNQGTIHPEETTGKGQKGQLEIIIILYDNDNVNFGERMHNTHTHGPTDDTCKSNNQSATIGDFCSVSLSKMKKRIQ
jgi:hypothetical protein